MMIQNEHINEAMPGESKEVIFHKILEHVPEWARAVQSINDIEIRRLSGMSNACYRVALRHEIVLEDRDVPRDLLYRKFTCAVVDRQKDAIVFKCMSDSGLGPKLVYSSDDYRIEHFIQGRPLSIWEMRNPVIMRSVVSALYEMHTKSGLSSALERVYPISESKLGVEVAIEEWGPACVDRMARIRAKLNLEDAGHQKIGARLDLLEQTYLKEGYQLWIKQFIPAGKPIITHSDVQENNILLSFSDSKVHLIDYEYGTWNPPMYDLGNYLNEMCCDNNYPDGCGCAHFLENYPTEGEIVECTRLYYELENDTSEWSLDNEECQQKVLAVKQCMVLNCFFWALWCIMMIEEENETNPDSYHWELIDGKCKMQQMCQERFGFPAL